MSKYGIIPINKRIMTNTNKPEVNLVHFHIVSDNIMVIVLLPIAEKKLYKFQCPKVENCKL